MSAQETQSNENAAFLQYKRSLLQQSDKKEITPFEKNIEIWRQLWRVIEKRLENISVELSIIMSIFMFL
ncbi:hypothetical protein MXB_2579 [Myxobolus squamalis]|nr:hypothetical protein MXB_2579 [Myxobolus squamalis]